MMELKEKRIFIIPTEEMLEKGAEMHEQVHGYTPDDLRYSLAYLLSSMSPGEILDILLEEAE